MGSYILSEQYFLYSIFPLQTKHLKKGWFESSMLARCDVMAPEVPGDSGGKRRRTTTSRPHREFCLCAVCSQVSMLQQHLELVVLRK